VKEESEEATKHVKEMAGSSGEMVKEKNN